ncbi:MAG: bifunctional 4-hydroxy-3-methylbut-2-enyl diphosphate reductase/30S ribosomal protein S1 [Clostridia bacterium]|nr:bifunctional 4-hydroxy-3-methylbut-2-enyl diphosphate reductase/30S ribosomal protein S1 [Clostridia bacterium]
MEIHIAEHAGFCFGVNRAIEMVERCLNNRESPLRSLGPLIHNPQVVAKLRAKGLIPVEDLKDLDKGGLVVRSHGVSPRVILEAENKGLDVIDATCPFVSKAQKIAHKLRKNNYKVVVIGDKKHPEVIALVGWAGDEAIVIENPEEADKIPYFEKIGVVVQTTQTEENVNKVIEALRAKTDDLVIHNTICNATRDRQESALQLARKVDVMIVVGGRNSSNTRKLALVCAGAGTPTYHIENADELCPQWFQNIDRVGITAGASTPDWIIEEVVQEMTEFNDEQKLEEAEEQEEVLGQEEGQEADEQESQEEVYDEFADEFADEEEEEAVGEEQDDVEEEDAEADEEEVEDMEDAQCEVEAHLAKNLKRIRRGEIVQGTVVQISEQEVLVDIGGKSEGIIPLYELSTEKVDDPKEILEVGDDIEVQILREENEEGHPVLSKKRVDKRKVWEQLEEAFDSEEELEAEVVEVVKGGLLVDLGIRGFVPASLVERGYVEDLSQYLGETLRLRVIELDRSRNKIVFSRKAILDEEHEKLRQETWDSLEEGQVREGVVRRITDFGAFVNLGGVDGLLHVSEISWGRVEHPADVLSEGQEMDVKVLGVDREEGKVSLGLKQLLPNPWETAEEKYPVGSIVDGKVLRIAPFGAFVEVEPGVEGLVHISQLADEHVEKTEDVVSIGEIIPVKILSVDPGAQRMSLSLRQARQPKVKEVKEERKEKTQKPVTKREPKKAKSEPIETEDEGSGIKIGDLVGDVFDEDFLNKIE